MLGAESTRLLSSTSPARTAHHVAVCFTGATPSVSEHSGHGAAAAPTPAAPGQRCGCCCCCYDQPYSTSTAEACVVPELKSSERACVLLTSLLCNSVPQPAARQLMCSCCILQGRRRPVRHRSKSPQLLRWMTPSWTPVSPAVAAAADAAGAVIAAAVNIVHADVTGCYQYCCTIHCRRVQPDLSHCKLAVYSL